MFIVLVKRVSRQHTKKHTQQCVCKQKDEQNWKKMLVDSFKGTDTKVVFNCYDIETQDA